MAWLLKHRGAHVVASPVRYSVQARQQTATIASPLITRRGLYASQPGVIGRG